MQLQCCPEKAKTARSQPQKQECKKILRSPMRVEPVAQKYY